METSDYSLERGNTHCYAPSVTNFFQFVVFLFLNDWIGHKAAMLILELRISVASLTAARGNYLGVRCVPKAASHDSLFSVSFGDNRPSNSQRQRPSCAHSGLSEIIGRRCD
jgi:hypothetical protein